MDTMRSISLARGRRTTIKDGLPTVSLMTVVSLLSLVFTLYLYNKHYTLYVLYSSAAGFIHSATTLCYILIGHTCYNRVLAFIIDIFILLLFVSNHVSNMSRMNRSRGSSLSFSVSNCGRKKNTVFFYQTRKNLENKNRKETREWEERHIRVLLIIIIIV